jgi:hypothetical protein
VQPRLAVPYGHRGQRVVLDGPDQLDQHGVAESRGQLVDGRRLGRRREQRAGSLPGQPADPLLQRAAAGEQPVGPS